MSLLKLPTEVTGEIISYVLTSPTGKITLRPTFYCPEDPQISRYRLFTFENHGDAIYRGLALSPSIIGRHCISLAFLRTCRHLYHATKDLTALWANNTWVFDQIADVPAAISSRIQHVKLKVDLTYTERSPTTGYLKLQHELLHVRTWQRLRSITLQMWDDPSSKTRHLSRNAMESCFLALSTLDDEVVSENLEVLKAAGGERGYLSHMTKSVIIDTSPDDTRGRSPEEVVGIMTGLDPNAVLAKWAKAFRGRWIVDDVLCYENGALVEAAFFPAKWKPDIARFYHRADIGRWHLWDLSIRRIRHGREHVMRHFDLPDTKICREALDDFEEHFNKHCCAERRTLSNPLGFFGVENDTDRFSASLTFGSRYAEYFDAGKICISTLLALRSDASYREAMEEFKTIYCTI